MSIDAISTSVLTGVGTIGTSSPDHGSDNRTRNAAHDAADREEPAPQDATVVTISEEARAPQQSPDQEALRQAAMAAGAWAVANAANHEWAKGTPAVDNGAVREALDALDEASRDYLNGQADALTAQSDQVGLDDQAAQDAATNAHAEQRALDVAATNASIQLAYGALASPLTGDAVLRQPGLETIA